MASRRAVTWTEWAVGTFTVPLLPTLLSVAASAFAGRSVSDPWFSFPEVPLLALTLVCALTDKLRGKGEARALALYGMQVALYLTVGCLVVYYLQTDHIGTVELPVSFTRGVVVVEWLTTGLLGAGTVWAEWSERKVDPPAIGRPRGCV